MIRRENTIDALVREAVARIHARLVRNPEDNHCVIYLDLVKQRVKVESYEQNVLTNTHN